MGLSRSRTLHLIAFLFLAALSLRPWRNFEAVLEQVVEPVRALRYLAKPLAWLSVSEVRAAESTLLAGEDARREACRAVLAAAQSSAAPEDAALAHGRGLVHAEVVDRPRDKPDRALIRFAPGSEVRRGMPVVSGDYFVGRIAWVDPDGPGEAQVDLVTTKDFRVGAEVDAPPALSPVPSSVDPAAPALPPTSAQPSPAATERLLVVGGVLPRGRGRGDLLLAATCPSDPSVASGLVRVREREPEAIATDDPFRGLADGFLLGTLERHGKDVLAVRPGVDYRAGLYQVAVVCPSEHARAGPGLAQDPFVDDRWIDATFALAGDPSFWREGRVVDAGRDRGLEDGTALALGSSLLGLVQRAGRTSSSARLLGDPGLELSAIASVRAEDGAAGGASGVAAVLPVGRLVSLGRARGSGELLLRWESTVPLEGLESAGPPIPAVLYTSSGNRAVPPGLRIGATALPRGRGVFVLRVRQDETGRGLARVRAWRGPQRSTGAPPAAGEGAGP